MRNIFLVMLVLVGVGCASERAYITRMNLSPGMAKKTVLDTMGKPQQWEIYEKYNKVRVEYLFYPNFNNYEEKTPLCFIDGKLVGWGNTYYQDHVSTDDKRIK